MTPTIRAMREQDWTDVARIYGEGIATGRATFETEVPSWSDWSGAHLEHCRLVATEDEHVLGWAALSPVSERCVYAGVGEVSVYVGEKAQGRGVGRALLQALVECSEGQGLWTLQAGVFTDNPASIRIHEACGFRVVGTRERLGQLGGAWKDVILLERRSDRVG